MIIAIDFDDTICLNSWPEVGEEIPGAIETIKKISKYNIIILWTCRVGEPLKTAIDFCLSRGIEFDYINENVPELIEKYGSDCRKITADIYIDDKSIFSAGPVVNWNTVNKLLNGVAF